MSDFAAVAPGQPRGMITLRGDLTAEGLRAVCSRVTGAAFPAPGEVKAEGAAGLAWMSPDEVLVMVPCADVAEALAAIQTGLTSRHFLAVDVSDARATYLVEGPGCREVMAKLCPVDMHRDAFRPGQFRRTRMGQIAAAFWMPQKEAIEVMCFRSVADYAFDLLRVSARAGPVGLL